MSDFDQNACGYCPEAGVQQTPVTITNPPGQPAVAYRVGTYAQFKQSMLARLKDTGHLPALQGLRTREDDDFSIALLDTWAMAADVLTFYQERIANESYRGTATEPGSLRELARMVNYPLRPGVAANAHLAFTVEDAPGAPQYAAIDIGTKVQSLPNPGEEPQLFETIEPIEARAEWNAIKLAVEPPPMIPQKVFKGISSLKLQVANANIQPGDAVLIVGQIAGNAEQMFRRVKKVDTTVQPNLLTFEDDPQQPEQPEAVFDAPHVFVMRTRASLFGSSAPDWKVMPDQVRKSYITAYNDAVNAYNRRLATGPRLPNQNNFTDWPFPFFPSASSLDLDRVYPQLLRNSWCVVVRRDGTTVAATVASVIEVSVVEYATSARVTRLTLNTIQRYTPASMDDIRTMTVYAQSEELLLAEVPDPTYVLAPVGGNKLSVLGSNENFERLRGRTIVVTGEYRADPPGTTHSEIAIVNDIMLNAQGGPGNLTLAADLANTYKPETVTINANIAQATQGETVQDEILGSGDASQLYQRFTLRQSPLTYIQDSTQQTGVASTLTVRVDDIEWKEVPTLFGHGPREHVYVTSIADDGTVTVQFGNGYHAGSRLPSGEDNVVANYRKGIGKQGLVQAGQLSLLITRPLGVKGVTNPFPASGAIDPETPEDAKRYADNTVLTLGLIVSIQDYEIFALSYASVAKAQATGIWNNRRKCVVVTIAGPPTPDYPAGTPIEAGSGLYEKIYTSMSLASDPSIPLTLQSFDQALFRIDARITINPAAPQDRVLLDVEQALRSTFSFSARAFGQDVTSQEVTAAIQRVSDVAAVRVNKLYRLDPSSTPTSPADTDTYLHAAQPLLQANGTITCAELLLVDPVLPIGHLEVIW